MGFNKKIWRCLPLLAAVLLVCTFAVQPTLALVADYTSPIVNTFCPDECCSDTADVVIAVQKTILNEGDCLMLPSGFHFSLTDTVTGETLTAVSNMDGQARFHLQYGLDDVGEHTYHLVEVNDGRPNVTYSELLYQVRVDVALTDAIVTTVYLDGVETERPVAQFENICRSDPDIPDTGDSMDVGLYAVVSYLCVLGIMTLTMKMKKYVG